MALLLLACACDSSAENESEPSLEPALLSTERTPFVLALVVAQSGEQGPVDSLFYQQVLSAQTIVNQNGGIFGHALAYDLQDSQATSAGAQAATQRLLGAGHRLVLGAGSAAQAQAIAEVARPNGALVLDAITQTSMVDDEHAPAWIRTATPNRHLTQAVLQDLRDDHRANLQVFTVVRSQVDPAADDIAAGLIAEITTQPCEQAPCIATQHFLPSASTSDPITRDLHLQQLLADHPAALYLDAAVADALAYLESPTLQDYYGPIYLNQANYRAAQTTTTIADPVRQRLRSASINWPRESAAYHAYLAAMRLRQDEAQTINSPCAFDLTLLAALALNRMDEPEPSRLAQTIIEFSKPPGIKVHAGTYAQALQAVLAGDDIDYDGACGALDLDSRGVVATATIELIRTTGSLPSGFSSFLSTL